MCRVLTFGLLGSVPVDYRVSAIRWKICNASFSCYSRSGITLSSLSQGDEDFTALSFGGSGGVREPQFGVLAP
jgi:hypothetical protein